MMMMMMISN